MDWLVAFRDVTLPGEAAADDLHTGATHNTIIDTGAGVFDAGGADDGEIGSFSLSKKVRVTSAETWRKLRALVGKRGYLWRGRRVSDDAPLGAVWYLPFNADGVRANLAANDGVEPTTESGSVVGVAGGVHGMGMVSLTQSFTNYVGNPVFKNNVTDFWTFWQAGSGGSATHNTTDGHTISGACDILASDTGVAIIYTNNAGTSLADGESATASAWYKDNGTAGVDIIICVRADSAAYCTTYTTTGDNEWHEITTHYTNNSGGSQTLGIGVRNAAGDNATVITFDDIQLTKTSYQLPFRYGDMPGCSWSGTPHASTTVVTRATLRYNGDAINVNAGTIALWIYLTGVYTDYRNIAWMADSGGNNRIQLYYYRGTGLIARFRDNAGNQTFISYNQNIEDGWHHVAMAWGNEGVQLYLGGTEVASSASVYLPSVTNPLTVGAYYINYSQQLINGSLVDFFVAKTALSASTIKAIYNSGVPLSDARIQLGIDARCVSAQATRQFDEPSHTDMTLDFATIGRAWRGEVRQIANERLSASGNLTLTNAGNVTAKNLVVRIIAAGAATVTLSMNGFALTVSAGAANDELVVDCGAHTVRKNGSDDYTNATISTSNTTADWLPLEPGENTLSVTLSGAAVEIIAQWYDAYR